MSEISFAHPHTLLAKAEQILDEVGPKKFFTSSDEEVKKTREGFVAYFFTLTLKEFTGQDWWVAQFNQAERQSPDFDFISFSENISDMRLEPVELTGVYTHFKTFEDMMEVVEKKQMQYGSKPLNFSLLIFVNHERSEEWIKNLRERIKTEHPFLSVWTIHLLFKKGGKEVGMAIAQRIRPIPGLRIEVITDNPEIHKRQPLPEYLEEIERDGKIYVTPKSNFVGEFRKTTKRTKPK